MNPEEDRARRLEVVLPALNARLPARAQVHRGPPPALPVREMRLSPRFASLLQALHLGGLPRSRMVELLGPMSSGKVTLAIRLLAECQQASRRPRQAVLVDLERRLDPDYWARCGVDLDHLLIAQPGDGPEALAITGDLARSGAVDWILFDSTDALEDDFSAGALDRALARLARVLPASPAMVIFLTTRPDFPALSARVLNPERLASFLAPYAAVRLAILRFEWLRDGRDIVGYRSRVSILKNRFAPPERSVVLDLEFGGPGL